MKTATKVFLILGMIGTIIGDVYSIVSGFMLVSTSGIYSLYIIFGLIGLAISIIVGSYTLKSVSDNDKKIGWGIASIIFVGLIGGILYLCWDPYEGYKTTKTNNNRVNNSTNDYYNSRINMSSSPIENEENKRCDNVNNEVNANEKVVKEEPKVSDSNINIDNIENTRHKLEELKKMKDEGLISQEVYDQKSKELIDKM